MTTIREPQENGPKRWRWLEEADRETREANPRWPTASDVAVHANVGLQVNCGSSRRALEMTRMTDAVEKVAVLSVGALDCTVG